MMYDYMKRSYSLLVIEKAFVRAIQEANTYLFVAFGQLELGQYLDADVSYSMALSHIAGCKALCNTAYDYDLIDIEDWQTIHMTLTDYGMDFVNEKWDCVLKGKQSMPVALKGGAANA